MIELPLSTRFAPGNRDASHVLLVSPMMLPARNLAQAARSLFALALLGALAQASGCKPATAPAAKPAESPAKVATIAHEETLNTIVLTPEAEKRLGITLTPVEARKVKRTSSFGGEIMLPTGASIIVSAPLSGTLQLPPGQKRVKVGQRLKYKQPMLLLLPLLSPERAVLTPAERIRFAEARNAVATQRIDAEGLVQQAKVQVEAAQIALNRAERLLREQAGNARTVDEAKAQLSLAEKALHAAQQRKELVDNINLDEEAGNLTPLAIEAPQDGVLRAEHAAVGEVVAVGAPLFEVMDYDPIWIRVPVYVGELPEILADQPAQINGLSAAIGSKSFTARPVSAPPTAAALSSTVDMYYELPNADGALRPGEKVQAQLTLRSARQARLVPWSAVIHDINGGTWVYENTAAQTYVRRRVQVGYVVDSQAVLEDGPPPGAKIVGDGAMELFGTEFAFGK
jgi:cobalt-zinc-cadmium efflux system membrane fusion protein